VSRYRRALGDDVSDAAGATNTTAVTGWQPRPSAWLRQPRSRFADAASRPLFIGACPRSGTTLLRSLLNNHPDLAVPVETNFAIPLWANRDRLGDLRVADNRRRVAEWIFDAPRRGGRRMLAGVIDRDEAVERVVHAPPTLGSILAVTFALFAEGNRKPRWGDKRPGYAYHLGAVFGLFPNAQFVNVVRDPRATVASAVALDRYGQDIGAAVATATAIWETAVERVDRFARRLRPDQLLDVRYEDLVRDPAPTLQRVCDFCGLRAGDAVVQMLAMPRGAGLGQRYHHRVAEPVTASRIKAWGECLEPHNVALIEHATRRHFTRLGYEHDDGLAAEPRMRDLRILHAKRRDQRRLWRRYALGELKRAHLTYRRPVAALPGA
jgi:sulfotransferase family protein